MKSYLLLSLIILISLTSIAQTNDTPNLFSWKGKKTISEKGYVVLKSDKKLEGIITLKGSSSSLTGIHYVGEGKEIDFPLAALKSYGLSLGEVNQKTGAGVNSGPAICDHNESLFVWRDMGEVMGKKVENTKPRNGYVIKRDGTKVEGELQVKKSDGRIIEFKLKTSNGKVKLAYNQVANYGLLMTIDELTKSGEKVYKDVARNFHQGSVKLKDGSSKEGLIAFKKKTPINSNKPGLGNKYQGLYFANDENSVLKTYENNSILSVKHNGITYSPYQGGFVAENAMDNAKFKNKLKELNEGSLTLTDGSVLKGEIALVNQKSVRFKSSEGIITLYDSKKIKRFDVEIESEKRAVVSMNSKLTEEFFSGKTFMAYKNPSPTTINQKRTNTARSMVGLTTSATSAIVISQDEKKNGYETNLDSLVMNSSADELKKYQEAIVAVNGFKSSEELQEKSNNETAKKYDAALNLAIAGKESQEKIVIYYDEVILKNIKSNEEIILYKDKKDLNGKLEGLLMGCYTFLSLEKKDQKKYYDLNNISETTKMLDECY